jgi:hypothetical protein
MFADPPTSARKIPGTPGDDVTQPTKANTMPTVSNSHGIIFYARENLPYKVITLAPTRRDRYTAGRFTIDKPCQHLIYNILGNYTYFVT